jgi:hypothetical protein
MKRTTLEGSPISLAIKTVAGEAYLNGKMRLIAVANIAVKVSIYMGMSASSRT